MKDGKFEAEDIYALLRQRFNDSQQWLTACEVSNTTGWAHRRLDFVAANCYAGNKFSIDAFEVKISKSDLRNELFDPSKHNIFFDDIDTYSIVAPDYVLDAEYVKMIPKNWGIYRATAGKEDTNNTLKVYRKPIALHDEKTRMIRRGFAFSLIRAMAQQGAMRERDKLNAMMRAEYERGMKDGRKSISGVDYATLFDEERKKLADARNALSLLGVDVYSHWNFDKAGFEERARKEMAKREKNERLLAKIHGMSFHTEMLENALNAIKEVGVQVNGVFKSEKDEPEY